MMTFPQPRVDHVVLDTRDGMDEAVLAFETLGFQLTPRSRHSLGSINHLAVLEPGYLELLGFDPASNVVRADIAQFPIGLNGLVFNTESACELFRDLNARGVPVEEPVAFSRTVNLPGGSAEAKFRVVRFKKGAAPFGRVYFCQHLTPELIWRREWLRHTNAATGIESVSVALRDPAAAAEQFSGIFGPDTVRQAPGGAWKLAAGNTEIELCAIDSLQAQLGGAMPLPLGRTDFVARLIVRTESVARASEVLRAGAVPFTRIESGRVRVPAASGWNLAIEFVEVRP